MRLSPLLAFVAAALAMAWPLPAGADEEASNIPYVVAGTYGRCYAKSVPDDYYGERGFTRVYRVERERDELADSYPWFSPRLFLQCNMSRNGDIGASLVRFGPWPRGHRANVDQLAFAFYFKGELLKRYSTLDVAGNPDNVEWSVSHYQVIRRVMGYRWIDSNDYAFEVETVDGRVLTLDPLTGNPLPPSE